jgi:hypothetical protein
MVPPRTAKRCDHTELPDEAGKADRSVDDAAIHALGRCSPVS